jgi:hypothetical protein
MATLDELGKALVNADAAGDADAARALAGEITRLRQSAPQAAPALPVAATAEPVQAYDAMGMPTGAAAAAPVQAGMSYGDQMSRVGSALDKGVRLAANGATFGLADKFAGGMDALTGRAPSYDAGVKAQRAETQAVRDANPVAAGAAEAAGGLLTGTGLVRGGVTLAGRGVGMLPRVLGYGVEGGAYGAAHGAGNTYSDRIRDYVEAAKNGGTTGALIGGGLPLVGSAAGGLYRTGAAFLGPRVEGASRGASAMLRAAAQADEAGLRALPGMGPEAMLVDAGPAMKGLGQGAATSTGEGARLGTTLKARDDGTVRRLEAALDDTIGRAPTPSRVEAQLSGDRAFMGQEYEPLMQNARAVNTQGLADHLDTLAINLRGPAQRAVRQVREMLDIPGNPGHLDPHPRALLSTRDAIDGLFEGEVNPQVIRRLTEARQAVDAELARAVPGIKAVDAPIAELHRQSSGLQRGSQVLDSGKTAIRPVELVDEMAQGALPQGEMIGPSAASHRLRQGTRAELDRLVGTHANDLNTLERTIGTPQDYNSQKLGTIFGEGPRDRIVKALMDNRTFRQSYQDIVQGSQTAKRTEAAAAMRGAEGGNVPHDVTLTGVGLKALNMVAKAISGASNARTKDEIGNILASQGPAAQRVARALLESAQKTGENSRAINRVLSSPYWISATAPVADRKSTR